MNSYKPKPVIDQMRDYRKQNDLTQSEMGQLLGVSQNYIYMIEAGRTAPSQRLVMLFNHLKEKKLLKSLYPNQNGNVPPLRHIPVLSWGQVAQVHDFENVPQDTADMIPSDCPDHLAIGVALKGDAMEPEFRPDDIVVIAPTTRPANGDLVLAKLRDGSVAFRLLHFNRDQRGFKLSSYNSAYPTMEFEPQDVAWMHPVESVLKKIKKN